MRNTGYKRDDRPVVIYNDRIRHDTLRVNNIDGTSEIMSKRDALNLADSLELDLILIAEQANPPVCKIASLNKYLYELKQKKKTEAKKQRASVSETKEIRMGLSIDDHDLEVKAGHAKKFLAKNQKVKVTIKLRGRERGKAPMAHQLLSKFSELCGTPIAGKISSTANSVSAFFQ